MLLTSLQDIFETLKSNSQCSRLIHLKCGKKSLDDAFLNELLELMESCACSAIADSPYSLLLDFVIIIEEDLDEFIDDTHIKALLNL